MREEREAEGERERRWDELLPGVGRCHGIPSGDSIAARRAHQSLNANGREKVKVALKHWVQTSFPPPSAATHPTGNV